MKPSTLLRTKPVSADCQDIAEKYLKHLQQLWGPYKGILLFGVLYSGPLIIVNHPIFTGTSRLLSPSSLQVFKGGDRGSKPPGACLVAPREVATAAAAPRPLAGHLFGFSYVIIFFLV